MEKLPAGKYYVGDLCYVLHDVWDECCDLFFPPSEGEGTRGVQGTFQLKDGRRFASFSTYYGDGQYPSNQDTDHCVDSGSIGCILVSDIRDSEYNQKQLENLAAFVTFLEPFKPGCDNNGNMIFGRTSEGLFIVSTKDYEDDMYEDEEEYEDEDE